MENLSKLINRFLSHLGFSMPAYESCPLRNLSAVNKIIRDFLAHMQSSEDVAYGALLLLQRFKDISRSKSRAQDGHIYFMAAYTLSAGSLLVADKSTSIRFATQSFTLVRSSSPWIEVEKARSDIIHILRNNMSFDDKLPLFKLVIQRDFRSDPNQQFPPYPRTLVTNHPQFLTATNSQYNQGYNAHH